MTILHSKLQKTMQHLHLDCLLQSDSKNKIVNAIIDTGFDGDLLINHKIAEFLRIEPLPDKVSKTILGDGSIRFTRLGYINICLPNLSTSKVFRVIAIILPQETECIIGTSLLEKICRSNSCNLTLNYVQNSIDFIRVN